MSDGPFSRRAVMTYWLLHDISARLARSEMVAHQFVGDDIHRQQVSWADPKTLAATGTVSVNRGAKDWVAGTKNVAQVLPQYGFSARVGSGASEVRADISRRSGVISAFALDARSRTLFADARPERTSEGGVRARVVGAQDAQGGKFSVEFEWQVLAPIPTRFRPFVHFTSPDSTGESIAFQGEMDFSGVDLSRSGTYRATATAELPADASEGTAYGIRFGLFDPAGGERFAISSPSANGRVAGGQIVLRGARVSHLPEVPDTSQAAVLARLNREDKVLDFGPLVTNGALRLSYAASTWTLMPLPNSAAFKVRLNLARLGAGGREVARVEATGESGQKRVLRLAQSKSRVEFEVPGGTRSVVIRLR